MFSSRIPWDLTPNALSRLREAKAAAGASVLDLTSSNPTRVGLDVDPTLLQALSDPRARTYEPEARGLRSARDAVAAYYAGRGFAVDPNRIVLTASTSEAYSFLFKLLAGAGDRVLVPTPSYPLFDYLAGLDLLEPETYDLAEGGGWGIELESMSAGLDERTRAVLVVNPNNPTGSFLKRAERERLVGLLAGREVALIADEVFADYPAGPDPERVASLVEEDRVATFVLGGFSKLLGLPQVKLGWICVNGPAAERAAALARLALIADTYLSVGTPVQVAAPALLARLPELHGRIAARLERNRAALRTVSRPAVEFPEGGWSALLELPGPRHDEEWALELLDRHDVLVHPGYLFGFASEQRAVVSLLTPEDRLREGMARITRAVGG